MSCRGCTEAIECPENDLAPSEGFFATQPFSVVQNCPQGYVCAPGEFPTIVTFPPRVIPPVTLNPGGSMCIQTCLQLACLVVPDGSNDAVKQAFANQLFNTWATDQSFCNAIVGKHKKPTALPSACLGTNYTQVLLRGIPTARIVSGSPPPDMDVSVNGTGSVVLSGAPSAGGSFGFTVGFAVAFGVSPFSTISYTINVTAIAFSPPGSSDINLPDGTVGSAYTATFQAPGYAVPPLSWQVVSGALPPGLSLDEATGVVSGTPTGLGASYHFTILLQDHAV